MKRKSSKIFIFDSWALLAFLKKEAYWPKIEDLLRRAEAKKIKLFLSLINWGEIYYIVLRNFGSQKAGEIEELIGTLPIEIVPITRDLVRLAVVYKAKGGLSFADGFVLATAKILGGKIVTGDPELKKLKKEVEIFWLK